MKEKQLWRVTKISPGFWPTEDQYQLALIGKETGISMATPKQARALDRKLTSHRQVPCDSSTRSVTRR